MSRVFLIPGLGADCRIYKNIYLEGYEVVPCNWIQPQLNDTLVTYSQKVISQFNIKDNDVVIGNSMGGMLAIEIAKKVAPQKIIIISSIKSHLESPWYFYVFRVLPAYHLIPGKLYIQLSFWAKCLFYKMTPEDKRIYREMFYSTSPTFIKWAMGAILKWRNIELPLNLFHITGDNDIVFSHRRINNAIIVNGGNHAMIFNRAEDLNKILNDILAN